MIARTLVREAWDVWPLDCASPILYRSFYLEQKTHRRATRA